MLSSTLTVQPLATIRAPSSSAKRSSSFRGAKIPAAPMKVRFFSATSRTRMMRTRDMMMSGDNLRGNSPFRCDLFEFERYFDMSPCISIFFASIFSSSSWLFLSAKERERERRQTSRASAHRFRWSSIADASGVRVLERVDHSSSSSKF